MSYDRYKACRRHCSSLKALQDELPDIVERAKEYFISKARAEEEKKEDLFGTQYLGKNLPDELLGCKICAFIAKSPRGLKIHMRRTHRKSANEDRTESTQDLKKTRRQG